MTCDPLEFNMEWNGWKSMEQFLGLLKQSVGFGMIHGPEQIGFVKFGTVGMMGFNAERTGSEQVETVTKQREEALNIARDFLAVERVADWIRRDRDEEEQAGGGVRNRETIAVRTRSSPPLKSQKRTGEWDTIEPSPQPFIFLHPILTHRAFTHSLLSYAKASYPFFLFSLFHSSISQMQSLHISSSQN